MTTTTDYVASDDGVVTPTSSDEEVLAKLKKSKVETVTPDIAGFHVEVAEISGIETPTIENLRSLLDKGTPEMVEVKAPVFIAESGPKHAAQHEQDEQSKKRVGNFLQELKAQGVIQGEYFFAGDLPRAQGGEGNLSLYENYDQIVMEKSDWDRIMQHEVGTHHAAHAHEARPGTPVTSGAPLQISGGKSHNDRPLG